MQIKYIFRISIVEKFIRVIQIDLIFLSLEVRSGSDDTDVDVLHLVMSFWRAYILYFLCTNSVIGELYHIILWYT